MAHYLRQAARTAQAPYPELLFANVPYGYAIELHELGTHVEATVRCPWCGDLEVVPEPDDPEPRWCLSRNGARYVVAVPGRTPVLVPAL